MDEEEKKNKNLKAAISGLEMLNKILKEAATPRNPLTGTRKSLECGVWALKKQIPMKVEEIHVDEYFCPACGAENLNGDFKKICYHFCPICGQAICQED